MVSNIFYFHPENWGNDPIWLIFFRWVVQPPTSWIHMSCVFETYMSPTNPAHFWEDGVFFPTWENFPFPLGEMCGSSNATCWKTCEVRGFKVLSGSRIIQGSKNFSNIPLEHNPHPELRLYEGIPFIWGFWGCLGYTPGVCWGSLRRVLGTQHFRRN